MRTVAFDFRNKRMWPLAAIFAFAATLSAPAYAAAPGEKPDKTPQAETPQARYCVTVIDRLQPGQKDSKVLSRTCSADPAAAPRAGLTSSDLLAKFWSDVDYKGDWDEVYGDDGPCDGTGYGFSDVTDIFDGEISSYELFSGCHESELFTDTDYEGNHTTLLYGNQSVLPAGFNDNVGSIWIYNFGH